MILVVVLHRAAVHDPWFGAQCGVRYPQAQHVRAQQMSSDDIASA